MGDEAPTGGAAEDHGRNSKKDAAEENKSSISWVVDVETMLADSKSYKVEEIARWEAQQSIYRVPEWIKRVQGTEAYQPQVVALGPLHHGESSLLPMEEHKRRAMLRLVRRSGRPFQDFVAAVEEVAGDLRAAYGQDLGEEWRGEKNKERFVEVMVTDGCFLLELVLMSGDNHRNNDYLPHDPIFGKHGRLYLWPVIRSDMLVLENQLPLVLLQRLLVVLFGIFPTTEVDRIINYLVLKFLDQIKPLLDVVDYLPLGLHPLDIYHMSLVFAKGSHEARKPLPESCKYKIMPTAVKIHEAGIRIKSSKTGSVLDIHFENGLLSMPALVVDDSTERTFSNLMAFERLHVDSGTLLTDYVIFLDNIIESPKDVEILSSKGVLRNMLGSDKEVAKLFNGTLSRGAEPGSSRKLFMVKLQVDKYCSRPWNKWRASLIHTYFRNPWACISLVAAAILLGATLFQTIYTIVPFYNSKP